MRKLDYSWKILIILYSSHIVMAMGAYVWGPLGPFVTADLNITRVQLGALTSALYFVQFISASPTGILVDKIGPKIMLIFCLSTMAGAFFLVSISHVYFLLLVLCAIAGLGYGMINQIAVKELGLHFKRDLLGTIFGIRQTAVTIGAAIGAVIFPILAYWGGWRVSLWFLVGAMISVLLVVIFFYNRGKKPIKKGGEDTHQEQSLQIQNDGIFRFLKKTGLITIFVVTPLLTGAQAVVSAFLVLYIEEAVFPGGVFIGGFLFTVMIAGTIGRVGWGVFSDYFFKGNKLLVLIIICFVELAAVVQLMLLPFLPSVSEWYVHFISVLLGFGFLGFHGLLFATIADLVPNNKAGIITGIMVSLQGGGMVILPILFGFLVDSFSYFFGWMLLILLSLIAIISFMGLFRRKVFLCSYKMN